MDFPRFDRVMIHGVREIAVPVARVALFIVFFWFGLLKVMDLSPADPLVAALLAKALPFVPFAPFRIFFGIYEMVIGAAFLVSGMERLAVALLALHMVAAFLPLVVLPELTWQSVLVPTFEGQYIIKNLVIIALALSLAAHLHPLPLARSSKSEIRKKR